MDELAALSADGPRRDPSRIRTSSLAHRHVFPTTSPSATRAESPLRHLTSPSLQSPKLHPERPVILAPTPRRHLLESSASQHWLRTPPLSPTSSRAASPLSAYSPTSSTSAFPAHTPRNLIHHTSFSSLLEQEHAGAAGAIPTRLKGSAKGVTDNAMGRAWIRWMHKRGSKHWVAPSMILVATLIKFCIGLGSYSGQGTPPMFGDYEAQRHWMELTVHLPLREWYTYDLPYWGLDYPPLTAYVSWICGIIGGWIEPSWVALAESRGIETEGSKAFMRSTVIAWDALVYVPALVMFARSWQGSRSKRTQSLALLTLLLQPALLLVDFGHFQYNSVMLGFALLAMNFFATGQDLLGAVCFVLSLGFKQMALYYAPAIGSYLVAKCIYLGPSQGGRLFVHLALVTSGTFLLLFLPFLPPFAPLSTILHPISRIFPFARGLFEDKVANFWCASNVVFKWKNWVSPNLLVKLSAGLTGLGFLPSVIGMLQAGVKLQAPSSAQASARLTQTPFLPLLPYALLTSSMSFFLFSFQVHEKTILLPLMPITLLLSGSPVDSAVYSWGALVNNIAVFSMWPLLKRDGLGIQYFVTLVLWNRLIGYNPIRLPPKSFIQLLSTAVYTAAICLHISELLVTPPARYPDLFAVLNVLISTPVFILTWLWSVKCGVEVGWALGGLGRGSASVSAARPAAERRLSFAEDEKHDAVGGNYRQMGGRAVSLGFSQGRRRAPPDGSNRASSVFGGE